MAALQGGLHLLTISGPRCCRHTVITFFGIVVIAVHPPHRSNPQSVSIVLSYPLLYIGGRTLQDVTALVQKHIHLNMGFIAHCEPW